MRKRANGSMVIQSSDAKLSPVSNGIYGGVDTDQTVVSAKSFQASQPDLKLA